MKEIIFEVTQEEDGGFVAEALGESLFTQADDRNCSWQAFDYSGYCVTFGSILRQLG